MSDGESVVLKVIFTCFDSGLLVMGVIIVALDMLLLVVLFGSILFGRNLDSESGGESDVVDGSSVGGFVELIVDEEFFDYCNEVGSIIRVTWIFDKDGS